MLLKKAKGLQTLLNTLIQALPAFLNIGFVLFIVYFIFGILGVQLFGKTPHDDTIDDMTNFETVWNALITLYIVGTSETWVDVMKSVGAASSISDSLATTYFLVFMMIGAFIMMNLLITIITDAFGDASDAAKNSDKLAHFDHLVTKWIEYDPLAGQRLKAEDFLKMVTELPKPLWIDEAKVSRLTGAPVFVVRLHQLRKLHVPINKDSYVRYQDVVAAFALVIFNIRVQDGLSASKKCPDGVKWDKEHFSIHHLVAAERIAKAYKLHFATRESKSLFVLFSRRLRATRQDAVLTRNYEIIPLEKSQKEAMKLARFLLNEMQTPNRSGNAPEDVSKEKRSTVGLRQQIRGLDYALPPTVAEKVANDHARKCEEEKMGDNPTPLGALRPKTAVYEVEEDDQVEGSLRSQGKCPTPLGAMRPETPFDDEVTEVVQVEEDDQVEGFDDEVVSLHSEGSLHSQGKCPTPLGARYPETLPH